MYDIIIVGGGFSALVLANSLLDNKKDNFIILERNDRVGKKILVTGNGRCNLTNADLSVSHYHGADPAFCRHALEKYDNGAIERFFNQKGLPLTIEDGKYYPLSRVANCVLDVLRFRLDDHAVTGAFVDKVKKTGDFFTVSASTGEYKAKKVVFAFGGKSGQNLGTDGRSYALAQSLGHKITALSPSLVQMKSGTFGKGLKGIKHYAKVGLYDDKRFICESSGDFLITDTGVSGNTVFTLSAYLVGLKAPRLKVDFIPETTDENIFAVLMNKKAVFGDMKGRTLLTGCIHSRLAEFIAAKAGIADTPIKDIPAEVIKSVVHTAKNYPVTIDGTHGYEYSQVTHGGIATRDVDDVTYESKLVKGLYIIGEALDIDGDCGGYNLQFSFSSACCAAESLV